MPFIPDAFLKNLKRGTPERRKERRKAAKLRDKPIDPKAEAKKVKREENARLRARNKLRPKPKALHRPQPPMMEFGDERCYYPPQSGITIFGNRVRFDQAVITAVLQIEGFEELVLVVGGILVSSSHRVLKKRNITRINKGCRITGRFAFDDNQTVSPWPNPSPEFRMFGATPLKYTPVLSYQLVEVKRQCFPAIGFYKWLEHLEESGRK